MNIIYNIITHPEKKINHLIENICRNILFSFEDGFARLTKILEKLYLFLTKLFSWCII